MSWESKGTAAKAKVIEETKALADSATGLIFTDYRGLTVKAISRLRRDLRGAGAEYHVVKNTLFRRAFPDKVGEIPESYLSGPTAIAFVQRDEAGCAKVLADFIKQHPEISFKGGYISGKVFSDKDMIALSKLPSREELLSQILSLVEAPVRNVASIINESLAQVVRVIGAIEEQKSGQAA